MKQLNRDFSSSRWADGAQGNLARRSRQIFFFILVVVMTYFVVAGWFNPMQFSVLAGDDLRSFSTAKHGFGALMDLFSSVYRFRPVATAAIMGVVSVTHADVRTSAMISILIHAGNGLIFFYLVRRVLHIPTTFALGLTMVVMLNRFATYLFIQEEAITEGIGFAALLVLLILSLRLIEKPTAMRAAGIGILYGLLIHIHERYLVLFVPLLLLSIWLLLADRRAGFWLGGVTVLALGFNLAVKKLWLSTPVLVGTTTHAIDFDLRQMGTFVWWGLLGILGINRGPAYLTLEDVADSPEWIKWISIAAACLSLLLLFFSLQSYFRTDGARVKAAVRLAFLSLSFFLLLLASSVTIRQELRWVYSAFIVFVVLIIPPTTKGQPIKPWFYLALSGLILISMVREAYLRQWHGRYFGFQADYIATSFYRAVQEAGISAKKKTIVVNGVVPAGNWVFMGGIFSQMYHLPPLQFESGAVASKSTENDALVVVYSPKTQSFYPVIGSNYRITSHVFDDSSLRAVAAKLPIENDVSDPAKKRLFFMTYDHSECAMVVAPVAFICNVPANSKYCWLSFSHAYALGDGVNIEVKAHTRDGDKLLADRLVPPLAKADSPEWDDVQMELPAGTNQIRFRVYSQSGDSTADWLAMRDCSFN